MMVMKVNLNGKEVTAIRCDPAFICKHPRCKERVKTGARYCMKHVGYGSRKTYLKNRRDD